MTREADGTAPAFQIGESVYYVLPRAPKNGRPQPLFLKASISNITSKSVVIRVNGRHRIVKATKLSRTAPPGAWIK